MSTIADHIQSDDLRSTVIMVIYNLCNDFGKYSRFLAVVTKNVQSLPKLKLPQFV